MSNFNLIRAKNVKNNEFYTSLVDVERELSHYEQHFKDKVVFCNCNDLTWSAFWKYFHLNFTKLGLKKLVSTCYKEDKPAYKMEYSGGIDINVEIGIKTMLTCNGDFRNVECIEILKESDIVVTNPPFSLFREFVAQLIEHRKKFLIIGNKNAINCNEIFHHLKNQHFWFGFEIPSQFNTLEGTTKRLQGLCRWFTNLDIDKKCQTLKLQKRYSSENYPKYENFNAIEVSRVADIPYDYDGIMGVPITFLDKYNPDQFEILGRSGDINWAINECQFFTPPNKEKQIYYKQQNCNWRIQNSYIIKDGTIKCIYYRIFIRKIKS